MESGWWGKTYSMHMWFSAVANWTRKGVTFPQFIRESHEQLRQYVLESRPGVSVNE
jgi:predicted ATPase